MVKVVLSHRVSKKPMQSDIMRKKSGEMNFQRKHAKNYLEVKLFGSQSGIMRKNSAEMNFQRKHAKNYLEVKTTCIK